MNSEKPEKDFKGCAVEIFNAALGAVNPYNSVKNQAGKILSIYKSGRFKSLFVIGFGKASFEMAQSLKDHLEGFITDGIIITRYSHAKGIKLINNIKVFEAGHPVPDRNGVSATKKILDLLKKADETTLVVCLISGGGSALLVSPKKPVTLKDKQIVTEFLLKAGADIYEINAVRKHISAVKGGCLAEIGYPARFISLILSDVIGDRLDVIASGPTSSDSSTYDDAWSVIERYGLTDKIPKRITTMIEMGKKGILPETPKADNPVFKKVDNIIVGSNRIAIEAAKDKALGLGFDAMVISDNIQGEARYAGRWLAHRAIKTKTTGIAKPVCLISGGETTVRVTGKGKGGRNTELALAFAMEIEGIEGVTLLSAGTDGTDGSTDAAGAFADSCIVKSSRAKNIDPIRYLDDNDSYSFFREVNGLFITGPTGTNVMDIQIVLIA